MTRPSRPPAGSRIPASPLDVGGLHPSPVPNAAPPQVVRLSSGAQAAPVPPLRVYRPDRPAPAFPFVLLAGDKGAGKTWELAHLTADPRLGRAFFLEWGEADAATYLDRPGVDFELIEHEGTWESILGQIRAVRAEAARALAAGEPPVGLLVDTLSAEWDQVLAWTHDRARASVKGQAIAAHDPDASIQVGFGLWQDAKDRHAELVELLTTFPGVVVASVRAREAVEVDPDSGTPTGRSVYKVDGHKHLENEATAVVRLRNGAPPVVTKCVSALMQLNPVNDPPQALTHLDLGWLVFDVLGAGPSARPRRSAALRRDLTPGQVQRIAHEAAQAPAVPWEEAPQEAVFDVESATEQQWVAETARMEAAGDLDGLTALWRAAHRLQAGETVAEAIASAGARVKNGPVEPAKPRRAAAPRKTKAPARTAKTRKAPARVAAKPTKARAASRASAPAAEESPEPQEVQEQAAEEMS